MMLLLIYSLCALVGAAIAFWRSPKMPRYSLLLAIAAVPQLGSIHGIHIPSMFMVSAAVSLVWCACNYSIRGIPVVTLGIILNLLVMAFHGGAMPIDAAILAGTGYSAAPGTLLPGSKDIVVVSSPLALLSDWIVLPSGIVASPGDLVLLVGIVWWLVFSHPEEKDQPMMMLCAGPELIDQSTPLLPGQSTRPALTRLALLAAANPTVAENLLRDPLDAANSHPHYAMMLDARDRATLVDIRSRAQTVGEFLADLADVVDGSAV